MRYTNIGRFAPKKDLRICMTKELVKIVQKRHWHTRTGYAAIFQISLCNGKWKVENFDDVHNHSVITSPSKVTKFSSHNKLHLSVTCKPLESELNQAGYTPSNILKLVNVMNNDAHITPTQCSNILSARRKNMGSSIIFKQGLHKMDNSNLIQTLRKIIPLVACFGQTDDQEHLMPSLVKSWSSM